MSHSVPWLFPPACRSLLSIIKVQKESENEKYKKKKKTMHADFLLHLNTLIAKNRTAVVQDCIFHWII